MTTTQIPDMLKGKEELVSKYQTEELTKYGYPFEMLKFSGALSKKRFI